MYARLRLQLAVLVAKLCFLHFLKIRFIPLSPIVVKKFYELAVFLVDRRLQI